jgi:trk system potassium uptake protein TrkH
MTITTLVMTQFLGTGLRHRAIVSETLGADGRDNLRWILGAVVVVTLACEFVGAVALFSRLVWDLPMNQALWHATFHSVSAFCNAGFGLRSDNMTFYQGDVPVNLTICSLIVTGGLGFPVLLDVRRCFRKGWREFWSELHLHSKLTLIATAIALSSGAILVMILEWNATLKDLPLVNRVLAPCFHSVSCRTAGFNTLELGQMTSATLFISILLMLLGAGSCSTAGGIKVSTVSMLVIHAWTRFSGSRHVNVFRRTIPQHAIDRSMAATMVYLFIAGVGITCLLVFDGNLEIRNRLGRPFLDSVFECVSALGTVGLSTGITPQLSTVGKLIIIALMFLGRLGPITFFAALARATSRTSIEYATEEPLIG